MSIPQVGVQTRFSRENIKDGLQILCCEIALDDKDEVDVNDLEKIQLKVYSMNLKKKKLLRVIHLILGLVSWILRGHEHELSKSMTFLGMFPNLYYSGSLAEYDIQTNKSLLQSLSIWLLN